MERLLENQYLILASRILLALVFIWAAVVKIADPGGFASDIHNYRLMPIWSENLMALTLPWMELLVGLSLLTGYGLKGSSLLAFVMMAVFTAALILAIARGLDISCGCFGTEEPSEASSLWLALLRDFGLIALCLHVLRYGKPSTFG